MALSAWISPLKAALHTIKASHSFLSADLHSNERFQWLSKKKQKKNKPRSSTLKGFSLGQATQRPPRSAPRNSGGLAAVMHFHNFA